MDGMTEGERRMAVATDIIEHVDTDALHERLRFASRFRHSPRTCAKSLRDWKMEEDDAPLFRFLYRNLKPRRHLEFGTWRGTGTVYCLEESSATVWTINLLQGETDAEGRWAYDAWLPDDQCAAGLVTRTAQNGRTVVRTDARDAIGSEYLKRNLGHRVCQIYSDSRHWDDSNLPDGFFDSILIDGGHTRDVVESDTEKSLRLARPGGIIMWHDFCPEEDVLAECASTRGVFDAIENMKCEIRNEVSQLFWINPSWILLAVK
jgi:predicted O-methyltransferase YrrM